VADPIQTWRDQLQAWAIPEEILAAAPEPPWALPPQLFARRADVQIEQRHSTSLRRAEEALGERGSVLDVGAGAGAASLPLAARTSELVAVDSDPAMLDELRPRAARERVPLTAIQGTWPEVAAVTPVCDVAVCSHVLYNVQELAPFIEALNRHTRRRVVVEMTATHPTSTLNPLWLRFHGLVRPTRPTWEDAVRALESIGVAPVVEHELSRTGRPQGRTFEEMVAWTRRRLCLTAERDGEVGEALIELGVEPGRPETWSLRPPELITAWWERDQGAT
jgi:SAM-dependent methyltransferase